MLMMLIRNEGNIAKTKQGGFQHLYSILDYYCLSERENPITNFERGRLYLDQITLTVPEIKIPFPSVY